MLPAVAAAVMVAEEGAEEGKAATGDGADMAEEPSELRCGGLINMYLPGEPCYKKEKRRKY